MQISDVAIAQVTSASTAGDIYISFGFVPDFAMCFLDVSGTNPNMLYWFNPATVSSWPAQVIKMTGSTGVFTRDADAGDFITAYAGGDREGVDFSSETANTDGKHVDRNGALITGGKVTPAGIFLPDDFQTNSGVNIIVAMRGQR